MAELAKHLVGEEGVNNSRIVEVGCGKGEFLRQLVDDPAYGNSGIGFDPSYIGPESELGGRLRFERRLYDETCASVPADVVVCRHVIEHVPQPLELLRAVRRALENTNSPRIYFETPCVEWILNNRVIWDFFYEHCSLFSAHSLSTAIELAGFTMRRVRHVFGGQYLWLEAGLTDKSGEISTDAGDIPRLCQQFATSEEQHRLEWRARIVRLTDAGKVAIWGAGAKGTTFAHLVDPESNLIDCLVDLNPNKQGKFVPGTGHPIVGVEMLAKRGVRTAILMNPNYREENEALLASTDITIQLIE
jgi:SAM-dependent methyltransferase